MDDKTTLIIISLAALGISFLCHFLSSLKVGKKINVQTCSKVCGVFLFLGIVLLASSGLVGSKQHYEQPYWQIGVL